MNERQQQTLQRKNEEVPSSIGVRFDLQHLSQRWRKYTLLTSSSAFFVCIKDDEDTLVLSVSRAKPHSHLQLDDICIRYASGFGSTAKCSDIISGNSHSRLAASICGLRWSAKKSNVLVYHIENMSYARHWPVY